MRSLDPREVAALIKRGQDLLASGDVQSARLLLMRGAEARDARSALLVGTTYDPGLLRQIGADGPMADAAQARIWYQRAKEWGEPDAQRKLEALALSRDFDAARRTRPSTAPEPPDHVSQAADPTRL